MLETRIPPSVLTQLYFNSNPWVVPIGLLLVLGLAVEVPVLYGKSLVSKLTLSDDGWNVIQGAILGLVAFMLGISFSQSEGRFDARRTLVVQEANAIGTTWLRSDQLPVLQGRRFRAVLVDYTATRLHAYEHPMSVEAREVAQARSDADQAQMWAIATSALRAHPQNLGLSLLMTALNDTIDVSSEQLAALTHHVPTTIVSLTLWLVILGATLIGLGFARAGSSPRALAVIYVLASTLVVVMVLDLDRPQTGFVRTNLDPIKIQLSQMR
ncbi:MAG: hypothetical protein WA814_02935 [Candidatus Baltobacteraceae bacterium]